MQTDIQKVWRAQLESLGNDLAVQALRTLDSGLTVPSTLRADDPESVQAFEKFKSVLLTAYERGASDAQTGRVVCAIADISAVINPFRGSPDALLGTPFLVVVPAG